MSELSHGAQDQDDHSHPWWVVFETHNIGEAHIVAGRLQSEGIPNQILTYAGGAALGITIGMFGEVKILVSPSDYERAIELLHPESPQQIEKDTGSTQIIWEDED